MGRGADKKGGGKDLNSPEIQSFPLRGFDAIDQLVKSWPITRPAKRCSHTTRVQAGMRHSARIDHAGPLPPQRHSDGTR